MKHLLTALAVPWALALAPVAHAQVMSSETEEAKEAASEAVALAKDQMQDTFGVDSLDNGRYLWKDGHAQGDVDRVVVSLPDQLAFAYSGNELIGVSTISSGKDDHPTPTGIFSVLQKDRDHRSHKYNDAPMPFMQRIDQYGIALHAGYLPGHPDSHGCVRLPQPFASKLFSSTKLGTEVMIGA